MSRWQARAALDAHLLHKRSPVEVGKIDGHLNAEAGGEGAAHETEFDEHLAIAVGNLQALAEEVAAAVADDEATEGQTDALEDVHHVSLEFIDAGFFSGMRPRTFNAVAAYPKSEVAFFDTTPQGRILNRFSKDTDSLDSNVLRYA